MNEAQLAKALMGLFTSKFFWQVIVTMVTFVVIFYIISWAKNLAFSYSAYRRFKNAPHWSVGSVVRLDGFKGQISEITREYIKLRKRNEEMVISTINWEKYKWEIIHANVNNGEVKECDDD